MADWKMEAEIEYCVPCGYANLAAWMTSELFQAAGTAIAISLKPGTAGAFKVPVDGEVMSVSYRHLTLPTICSV